MSGSDELVATRGDTFRAGRLSYLPRLIGCLVLLAAIRLAGLRLSHVDLFFDEAQYWSWSQDLALGYFSKPPLLAWLIGGWTQVCGDAEWCVRSPAPILYAGSAFAVYLAGRQLYDERTGFWAALTLLLSPGVVFSSRIISTDVPLLFFWSVAMFFYVKLLEGHRKGWGIALGLAVGAGLLSKYAMVYFIAGVALAQFVSGRARDALRKPAIWLGVVVAVAVIAPNMVWNYQKSFATFRHTSNLVLGEPFQPSLIRAFEFVMAQMAVIGPILFPVMMFATTRVGSRLLLESDRLMVAFFVPPLLIVVAFASYSNAYANWAAPSLIPSSIAATALMLRWGRGRWLYASLLLGVALQSTLLVLDTIAYQLPARFGPLIDPYTKTLGWRDYAERAGHLAESVGAPTIATDDRRTFSTLRYYLRRDPLRVVSWPEADELPYDFVHPLTTTSPQPILLVTKCSRRDRLEDTFSSVVALGVFANKGNFWGRSFSAFILENPTGAVAPLGRCNAG